MKLSVEGYQTQYKLIIKKQGNLDWSPNDGAKKALKKCLNYQQLVFEKAKTDGKNSLEEKRILANYFY